MTSSVNLATQDRDSRLAGQPGSGLSSRARAKASRVFTIRSALALLVIACVIPASLMTALLISYNYQREHDRLIRDSIATARALVQVIDRELTSKVLAAEILGTSRSLESGDIPEFYAQAQSAVRMQIGNNVALSDATGQQVMNTIRPLGEQLPRHGSVAQLKTVFETGRPLITDLYVGGVLRRPLVSIDVPIFRGGKVVYDLSIVALPERFAAVLVDQRLPSGWIATVLDSTGTIVARTHEMERFEGTKGAPALVKRMAETAEDSLETNTVEGIPVLSVFSRSTISNWTVAIGIPTRQLTSELRRLLWMFILGVAFSLLISLAVAWLIGGRISRSIHGLSGPALALPFGGEVTVPALHLKEADEVGQALTKASKMLREAQHLAYHDALTGLPNRALFDEIVDQQIAICQRTESCLAILYIDLDGFKAVNDTYGHATGDELLAAVAARIKAEVRSSDIVVRLGGDEFAIALISAGAEAAAAIARKLANSFWLPYPIGQLTIEISASIGVATYPESGNTTEELLHNADAAMYKAKSDRKR